MSVYELKKGDRVDYRHHRNGEVLRVGRATIWAVFDTAWGSFPVSAPFSDFRPHLETCSVVIGEFEVRAPASGPGKVAIASRRTGEAMETDVARLESWLAKFWNREFRAMPDDLPTPTKESPLARKLEDACTALLVAGYRDDALIERLKIAIVAAREMGRSPDGKERAE